MVDMATGEAPPSMDNAPVSALAGFGAVQQLASACPAMMKAHWVGGAGGASVVPVGIFATLHALRVAYEVRKGVQATGRQPLLQELFMMLTFSFGGAILTGLMLGNVQPWLETNTTVPVYATAYLLMARMPGDALYRLLRRLSPVSDVFLASVDGLVRGYGVTTAGVDLVRSMRGHPISDSLVAWVLVGTVLGSGGGLIDDVLQISRPRWAFRTPSIFTAISLDVKLSFTVTVGYILSTHAWSFTEHAPAFPLSPLLDRVLALVPHLSDQEAQLVSGLLCSAIVGTTAHAQAAQYAAAERAATATARRKKFDSDEALGSDGSSPSDDDVDSAGD
ncbi:hypothetical protein H4R24_002835 [Coemansia sp. RSA 988]|nr:hypothetical protein H4R24_002835 [Coemansia sp. RSA 988]